MTETKLFVSSCDRRELARRRNRRAWVDLLTFRTHPALASMAVMAICAAAFLAGRGTI